MAFIQAKQIVKQAQSFGTLDTSKPAELIVHVTIQLWIGLMAAH